MPDTIGAYSIFCRHSIDLEILKATINSFDATYMPIVTHFLMLTIEVGMAESYRNRHQRCHMGRSA